MTLHLLPPYREGDDPPPSAPAAVCPDCDEGTVLVGFGEPWEHHAECSRCSGTGTLDLHTCETCRRTNGLQRRRRQRNG